VLGVPVLVSRETGPAVVGVLSAMIVVPEWALSLAPLQLMLMLEHEQEHRRAADGRLLAAAYVALVAMPWNAVLWWQVFRLRVAVELDCDARVLRHADARSYGDLLLEVARPHRSPRLAGMIAFAERATQLERRIRCVARQRDRAVRGARAGAGLIALATLTVAWAAPRPSAPAHALRLVFPEVVARRDPMPPGLTDGQVARRQRQQPDSLFQILFSGLSLTPGQTSAALSLLATLEKNQIDESVLQLRLLSASVQERVKIIQHRDSLLLQLLDDEDSRALLQSRLIPPNARFGDTPAGARGSAPATRAVGGGVGGGSTAPGTTARGESVGPGMVVRASYVGPGGRGGGMANAMSLEEISDRIFQRLFEGMLLSPEQRTAVRAAIFNAEQESREHATPPPQARIHLRSTVRGVVVDSASSAALLGILTSDADRATVASRMLIAATPR
jgi:uncharacterized membrane protein